jgi:hypothetical protein
MINHKKTILALVLCTFFYQSNAISPPFRSDSIVNCTSSSDSMDRLSLSLTAEKQPQRKKGNETNNRAGWFSDFFDALTSPFRPVWGAYEEKGQNTAAPLALFKRSSFAQDKAYVIAKSINNK